MIENILAILIGAGLAALAIMVLLKPKNLDFESPAAQLKKAEEEVARVKEEVKELKARWFAAVEAEEKNFEETQEKVEEVIRQKEELVRRREERNKVQETQVNGLQQDLKTLREEAELRRMMQVDELSKRSKLSREKALEMAKAQLEELITRDAEFRISSQIDEFTEEAPRHAKAILTGVIQRLSVPSSVDHNNTNILVKDDKFKGLLIGKNGMNVTYLESLLPVFIIFNFGDPETIHVGGVNLIRRHIAKRAIEKLQVLAKKTGRMDHTMIKKAVEEGEAEIMSICDRRGEDAFRLLSLDPKKAHPEMVNYTGRLYFRTSYGQNVTGHSNEMAFAARMISDLIGARTEIATQGAFFHDIGKAIDHDVGGAHDDLSKEILERYNYDPGIVHAAFAHHDKVPCVEPEDYIVKAVDAISGGRPGARQESVTNYFERIQKLESIAKSFRGVSKVFAMSAGRELRLIVDKDQVQDGTMQGLAEGVAKEIVENVAFPGVIKVNVIRVTRSVDYAREKMGARY